MGRFRPKEYGRPLAKLRTVSAVLQKPGAGRPKGRRPNGIDPREIEAISKASGSVVRRV